MKYRWNKSELYFKYLLSYVIKDTSYHFIIKSLLKQYDLSKNKSFIEKYSINEKDYNFSVKSDYFYDGLDLIPTDIIEKIKNIYLTWEDIEYFQQKFTMPKQNFTNEKLMCMLDDVIESTNNPDILRAYERLVNRKSHTYNFQKSNKNSKGELLITGLTIYDKIFNKNYINLFRRFNADDFITLTHETMHAIFNLLEHEEGINYDEQQLFLELDGYLGTFLACNYLQNLGYEDDVLISRRGRIDYLLFLSSALIIGDLIFSLSKNDFNIEAANEKANFIIPTDRRINIQEDFESYINYPAMDIIIDIIDYITTLELMEKGTPEAVKNTIDIKLNNNNELIPTLKRHNITCLDNNFAILKKEFTRIK